MKMSFGAAVRVDCSWTELKGTLAAKYLRLQYVDNAVAYYLFALEENVVYTTTIWKSGARVTGVPDTNAADLADFEAKYKAKANQQSLARTSNGLARTTSEKTNSSRVTIVSHNWCDKTTWAQDSVLVVNEMATRVNAAVYQLAHTNVIDSYHGKMTTEDYAVDSTGQSYRVQVKVNGNPMVEQDPHFGTGGDFTVDYVNGRITFFQLRLDTDIVLVTYHYARTSKFTIAPTAGKKLVLEMSEAQFGTDIVLTDALMYRARGYAAAFAPQLGLPAGTKIDLANPVVYKSAYDYLNDSYHSYPVYPRFGGTGWRGLRSDIIIFDWDYVSRLELLSSAGMEIQLSLQHDTPIQGSFATISFYCLSENE